MVSSCGRACLVFSSTKDDRRVVRASGENGGSVGWVRLGDVKNKIAPCYIDEKKAQEFGSPAGRTT